MRPTAPACCGAPTSRCTGRSSAACRSRCTSPTSTRTETGCNCWKSCVPRSTQGQLRAALPAAARSAQRRDRRGRGPAALGPPRARPPAAAGVPALRRGCRADAARSRASCSRDAIAQCAQWRQAGKLLTVSVNISATNLGDPHLKYLVRELLDIHGVPPRRWCSRSPRRA